MSGAVIPAEPTWHDFIGHLRVTLPMGARILLVCAAIGLVASLLVPTRYQSHAQLAVLPAPEFTARPDSGEKTTASTPLDYDQVMKAETSILESDHLHAAVIAEIGRGAIYPEIDEEHGWVVNAMRAAARFVLSPWIGSVGGLAARADDTALARFSRQLRVLPNPQSNVIELRFTHKDPEMAARALTILLRLYADQREMLYQEPQTDALAREMARKQADMAAADVRLADFKRTSGIANFALERDLLLQRRSGMQNDIVSLEAGIDDQAARMATLSRQLALQKPDVALFNERDPDSRTDSLESNLADAQNELAAARLQYREGSLRVRGVKAKLVALEKDRRLLARDPAPSVERVGRNPMIDPLRLDRARASVEHESDLARLHNLRAQETAIGEQIARMDALETQLNAAERRKGLAESALAGASDILAQRQMNEAAAAERLTRVSVIEPARVPVHMWLLPALMVLAGVVMGGIFGASYCVVGFLRDPQRGSEESMAWLKFWSQQEAGVEKVS